MNIDETVVVKTFAGDNAAIVAASRLESDGIDVHIQKDDCGGAYPSLQMSGGVRLLVKPEDLEDAEDSGEIEEEEQPTDGRRTQSSPILLFGMLLLGLAGGYFLSPELTDLATYTGVAKERYANGKVAVLSHYVNGRIVRAEEDRNRDGKPDAWYKYGAGKPHSVSFDDNFDGRPDSWVTYKDYFDSVQKTDSDFDGIPDATAFFANGLTRKLDWHPNDSAIITRREFYEHNVLVEALVDTDKNGVFDLRITYDPFQNPIKKEKCRIPGYSDRR